MAKRRDKPFPFSNQGANFTQTPNEIYDLQRDLPPNAFGTLLAISRATNGWHILFAPLTHADLMAATGIASRTTMRQCLAELLKRPHILRVESGSGRKRRTYYGLFSEETYLACEEVRAGRLTIDEAKTAHAGVDNPRVIHTRPERGRSKSETGTGPPPAPESRAHSWTRNGRTDKKPRTKQEREEPSLPPLEEQYRNDTEAAERLRDLRITRKRFKEKASEKIAQIFSWVEDQWKSRDGHP